MIERKLSISVDVAGLTMGELRQLVSATKHVPDDYPLYEETGVRGALVVELDLDDVRCLWCFDVPAPGATCPECGTYSTEEATSGT